MGKEAEGNRMVLWVGAFKAGASDHHMKIISADVVPDALPQKLDHWLGAIGLQHAGAAKLEKAQARMRRDDGRYVEFCLRIEAGIGLCHFLPEQAVGSDQFPIFQHDGIGARVAAPANNDEMIANTIKAILILPALGRLRAGPGGEFFVEHKKSKLLAGFDFSVALRLPQNQVAALGPDVFRVRQLGALPSGLSAIDLRLVKVP